MVKPAKEQVSEPAALRMDTVVEHRSTAVRDVSLRSAPATPGPVTYRPTAPAERTARLAKDPPSETAALPTDNVVQLRTIVRRDARRPLDLVSLVQALSVFPRMVAVAKTARHVGALPSETVVLLTDIAE